MGENSGTQAASNAAGIKWLIAIVTAVVVVGAVVAYLAITGTQADTTQAADSSTAAAEDQPAPNRADPVDAPAESEAEPAAQPALAAPVAGAFPGAGGPRPATAVPLPTYTGRYSNLQSAHLLSPSENIGCDFNTADSEGKQGLCGVVSFNTTSSPLGTEILGGQPKGKWVFPLAGDRFGDPTASSGTTGWMNQPANDGYTVPVAEYGKQYYFDDWVCASELNGMTCWNTETGSGVFMSKENTERFDGPATSNQAPAAPSQQPIVFGSEVSNGKGMGESKPAIIYFGSDPTGRVMNVQWKSWGGDQAEASGLGNWRPVEGGGPFETPAEVVAFDIGTCNGVQAYRKAVIYFPSRGQSFNPANAVDICFTDR